MKRTLPSLVFCVLCVSAWAIVTGPPPIPRVRWPHKSTEVQRGASKLITKIAPAQPPTTNDYPCQFPTGIDPASLWWNVEASSDLENWIVVISNATGPGEVRVKRTDPPGFYRLAGRPSP